MKQNWISTSRHTRDGYVTANKPKHDGRRHEDEIVADSSHDTADEIFNALEVSYKLVFICIVLYFT